MGKPCSLFFPYHLIRDWLEKGKGVSCKVFACPGSASSYQVTGSEGHPGPTILSVSFKHKLTVKVTVRPTHSANSPWGQPRLALGWVRTLRCLSKGSVSRECRAGMNYHQMLTTQGFGGEFGSNGECYFCVAVTRHVTETTY